MRNPKPEHPMPCSKCRKTFDAWGYTLSQRTRGPWRGLCDPCKETANLKGWSGKEDDNGLVLAVISEGTSP